MSEQVSKTLRGEGRVLDWNVGPWVEVYIQNGKLPTVMRGHGGLYLRIIVLGCLQAQAYLPALFIPQAWLEGSLSSNGV